MTKLIVAFRYFANAPKNGLPSWTNHIFSTDLWCLEYLKNTAIQYNTRLSLDYIVKTRFNLKYSFLSTITNYSDTIILSEI
jgi:hypothetical protein